MEPLFSILIIFNDVVYGRLQDGECSRGWSLLWDSKRTKIEKTVGKQLGLIAIVMDSQSAIKVFYYSVVYLQLRWDNVKTHPRLSVFCRYVDILKGRWGEYIG